MAWIPMIDEDDADGSLADQYARVAGPWGGVDNIMKIHSLNPPSLKGHFDFYVTLMRGRSGLSRPQREMIAVVVSSINKCVY